MQRAEKQLKTTIDHWLQGPLDSATRKEIEKKKEDPKFIEENFAHPLDFGTGGVRAKMGPGPSLLNVYTIQMLTQGLANYLLQEPFEHPHKRVVICFDTRTHSKAFAEATSDILTANGIEAYLITAPRPTPYLSFAIPHFHAMAGIMITASHNPPEYNGYKVFWKEGGQVVHPHDQKIIEEVRKIDSLSKVKKEANPELFHPVGIDFDEIYLRAIHTLQFLPKKKRNLHIVYTPLHGTGLQLAPKALTMWGFSQHHLVKEQSSQDGTFSHAPFPNPEEKKTLSLGATKMMKEEADILLATDPDADRVGVVVRHGKEAIRFTGNQIASLLLHFIITNHPDLPSNSAFVKSIVTTELFAEICKKYNYSCFNVLTGFKYIAEKIIEWESSHKKSFIFGAEESCGYLYHSFSKDKDGILSVCLIAEMAQKMKEKKKNLLHYLHELYEEFGIFREGLQSKQIEALSTMKEKMNRLRNNPPKTFAGIAVESIEDYQTGKKWYMSTGKEEELFFPSSNALLYWLEDRTKIVIRPSGTEPKVKFYVGVSSHDYSHVEKGKKNLDEKVLSLLDQATSHFH